MIKEKKRRDFYYERKNSRGKKYYKYYNIMPILYIAYKTIEFW